MKWEEAEKTRLAIADLKESRGWELVTARLEERKEIHDEAAKVCGPPTHAHIAARERLNEIEDFLEWVDQLEANSTSRMREKSDEPEDLEPDTSDE